MARRRRCTMCVHSIRSDCDGVVHRLLIRKTRPSSSPPSRRPTSSHGAAHQSISTVGGPHPWGLAGQATNQEDAVCIFVAFCWYDEVPSPRADSRLDLVQLS
jgi:hypothetical protein